MANTIELIDVEAEKQRYWDKYWAYTEARNGVMALLRALGVKEFPENRDFAHREANSTLSQPLKQDPRKAPDVTNGASNDDLKLEGSAKDRSFSSYVREACSVLNPRISTTAIRQYLASTYPDYNYRVEQLRSLVSSMATAGKLNLVSKGEDGAANVYRLP